jgi:hypothetical protein
MIKGMADRLHPEVRPGKFLAFSGGWSRHAYLIDKATKARLVWLMRATVTTLVIVVIGAQFIFPGGLSVTAHVLYILSVGFPILVIYSSIYNRLVRKGEPIEKSKIDPKLRRTSLTVLLVNGIFARWPRWVLLYMIAMISVSVLISTAGIVFLIAQGKSVDWEVFAIYPVWAAIVVWLIRALIVKRRTAPK